MDVTNRGEAVNRRLHILRLDHDHEVDDRLGGETGDSGGTNVLDHDGEFADDSGCPVAKPLELDRPRRAVVDDDDWIRHGAMRVVHLIHPARTRPAQNRAARDTPGTVPDTPAADTSRAGPVWTG